MRRFGTPKWNVSHEFRVYPEGWNTDEGRDSTLEYRLSIFTAEAGDTGIFTCTTPARHSHSVNVEVKAVHCPEIIPRRGLVLSTTETQMGKKVTFSCNNGNALIGTNEIVCLASGNWSGILPVCESMKISFLMMSFYKPLFNSRSRCGMWGDSNSRIAEWIVSATCCNHFTRSWWSSGIFMSTGSWLEGTSRNSLLAKRRMEWTHSGMFRQEFI